MFLPLLLAAAAATTTLATPTPLQIRQTYEQPVHNNFSCISTTHPNPIILFHGLGATYYEDLNYLETYLQSHDFCTFSITYGDYPLFPYVGGLKPINESAVELADFVRQVHAAYPGVKVDFLGHSEGAFQTLYVSKFEEGISEIVEKIVAIAPPTHGTSFFGLYNLSYIGGNLTNGLVNTILDTVGCAACDDVVDNGPAIRRLNDGQPIVQPGNEVTIIASKYDELVTPTETSFVYEEGVRNLYIQDFCPKDPVGHIGEAYDLNVWTIVLNTLEGSQEGPGVCTYGSPGR